VVKWTNKALTSSKLQSFVFGCIIPKSRLAHLPHIPPFSLTLLWVLDIKTSVENRGFWDLFLGLEFQNPLLPSILNSSYVI